MSIYENLTDGIIDREEYTKLKASFMARANEAEKHRAVVVALIDRILIHSDDVVEIIYRWQDEFAWQLDILRNARLQ